MTSMQIYLPTRSSKLLKVSALILSNFFFKVKAKSVRSTKCCHLSLFADACHEERKSSSFSRRKNKFRQEFSLLRNKLIMFCHSKKEAESNDTLRHFVEFSNVHNKERSSNGIQSNPLV